MKNKYLLGSLLVASFFFSLTAEAEESKTELKFRSGSLMIEKVRPLNFGEIIYSSNGGNYKPIVNLNDYSTNLVDYQATPAFLVDEAIPPATLPDKRKSLIDIKDDRIGATSWKLSVSRSAFINEQTNNQLEGTILYLGNPEDTTAPKSADYALSNVVLYENKSAVVAADYQAGAASGLHLISYFSNVTPVGEQLDPDLSGLKPGPFQAEDVILYLPPNLKVEPGTYRSTITWSLEDAL